MLTNFIICTVTSIYSINKAVLTQMPYSAVHVFITATDGSYEIEPPV